MDDEFVKIKRKLRNVQGNRLLLKNKQEYSEYIIKIILEHPEFLGEITNELEITEEDFYKNLSGEINANISFYDQTLVLCKKKLPSGNQNNHL